MYAEIIQRQSQLEAAIKPTTHYLHQIYFFLLNGVGGGRQKEQDSSVYKTIPSLFEYTSKNWITIIRWENAASNISVSSILFPLAPSVFFPPSLSYSHFLQRALLSVVRQKHIYRKNHVICTSWGAPPREKSHCW